MLTNITAAMSPDNLPIATIRRFARTTFAYLYAYKSGKDIITAHDWVKKHRSHRGHSKQMDHALENSAVFDTELEVLYYPLGRHRDAIATVIVTTVQSPVPVLVENDELGDDNLALLELPTIIRAPVPASEQDDVYDSDLDLHVESDDDFATQRRDEDA